MSSLPGYRWVTGTAEVSNTDADEPVIAAQGAAKVIRLMKATISVSVIATGGGGEVALEDGAGGTRLFEADADALGVYHLDFGPLGYPLTADTALNLTVDGAATTQATARCTAAAYSN